MYGLFTLLRRLALCVTAISAVSACVYRIDVQQGNLLEQHDVEAVKPGMTRSQVRFLLGTPLAESSFRPDRWDYMYFFRKGRSRRADREWLIVFFDDDRVREIQKDVPVDPI
jgi:outer membrane protein assembly factor BamE